MGNRVVAVLGEHLVGRHHGPLATHVAVIVLACGRIQCRGWGLRVEAEAALARALRRETGLRYAAVHTTRPDADSGARLTRRTDQRWSPRRVRTETVAPP